MNIEATRLTKLFTNIAVALDSGELGAALKWADSARRFAPTNPTAIVLQSNLLLRTGAARSAAECVRGRFEPESLIVRSEAACAAGLPDDAGAACRLLLSRYAVDAISGLSATASRLTRVFPERFPGWVGVDSSLRLVGELPANCVADIEHERLALAPIDTRSLAGSPIGFAVVPPAGLTGDIRIRIADVEILGSGLCWPPDFGFVGWVVLEERLLIGELCLDWMPQSAVTVIVSQGAHEVRRIVEPVTRGLMGWCFSVSLDDFPPHDADVQVFAVLPDRHPVPLCGSPLKLLHPLPRAINLAPPLRPQFARPAHQGRRRLLVNVVIPVHTGLTETLDCLHSVLLNTDPMLATITVVDDASPDPALRQALDDLACTGRVTILRNLRNLGFPGAANRGMRLHRDRDVVLLNSDAEVFDGWLERLADVAYCAADVGSVTPFGECASITTFSSRARGAYSSQDAREIDRIARAVNGGKSVDIPVGVGFCLYLRRPCLDEIGEFDEGTFGKGYGEENDFCLRARDSGWRHLAATNVFVRHSGGVSYGRSKQVLTLRNSRVINYRYPGYDELIAAFIARDPLRGMRRAIDQQRLLEQASTPVLLLSVDLPGGVHRHVEHRQATLGAAGCTVLVLRAAGSVKLHDSIRVTVAGSDFEHLLYELPQDLDELRALLLQLGLIHIEIHHFLGLSAALLEMVVGLGVPYRAFIHDYAWICPRVSLLNGDDVYCGEPVIDACEACVQQHGTALSEPMTVTALRGRSSRVLAGADRVMVPSLDARNRLQRHYADLHVDVTPWESCGAPKPRRAAGRDGGVRVALIGAIGTPKGYSVLLECARDAANRCLPLEFVVVGYTRDDSALLETGCVFITGPYEEHEAAALLERESCDIALFPSQAPETWCYSLTYALDANLPIVAFDIGAVAERVRASGTGLLLPRSTAPAAVNNSLLQHAAAAKEFVHANPRSAELIMQSTHSPESQAASGELSASVQVITLPIGIYAFTVKGGGTASTNGLAAPALQVATAPVRSNGVIQFLEGPSTLDRWLTRVGDVIMVKISGDSATLLLTSLRAADSGVLAIDVRRLDVAEPPTSPLSGVDPPAVNGIDPPAADGIDPPAVNGVDPPAADGIDPPAVNGVDPPAADAPPEPVGPSSLPLRIVAHVQNLGDLEFREELAGRVDENLWIEAFSAAVDGAPDSNLLEYCGVTYLGEETAWLSDAAVCGSRGEGVPLVAFAVRVKEPASEEYACAYSGRFLSGGVVGPFSDGRLCRSGLLGDPLVGIELRLEERQGAASTVSG